MAAHQKFCECGIPFRNGIDNLSMLIKGSCGARGQATGAMTAHANQLVELAAEHLDQPLVFTTDSYAVMKVEIPFTLEIHLSLIHI